MDWFEHFVKALQKFDADWAYWPLFAEGGAKPGSEGAELYGTLSEKWTPKSTPDRRLELLSGIGLHPSAADSAKPILEGSKVEVASFPGMVDESACTGS